MKKSPKQARESVWINNTALKKDKKIKELKQTQ
jgi:hypothetical protein